MKVSIILPVLNEQPILNDAMTRLKQALDELTQSITGEWEVTIVDAGSTDGSVEIARAAAGKFGWRHLTEKIPAPSVGKTVTAGLAVITGEVALILPCDTSLDSRALASLHEALALHGKTSGGFEKRYLPSTWLLQLYAKAQNIFRTRIARHLVWTNGIFFSVPRRREGFIPTGGFLEDVILSDRLRREKGWTLVRQPIQVSARRYYPNRVVKRISVNFLILLLYRLRIAGPERLQRLYTSLK